jgi:hypothetical protein
VLRDALRRRHAPVDVLDARRVLFVGDGSPVHAKEFKHVRALRVVRRDRALGDAQHYLRLLQLVRRDSGDGTAVDEAEEEAAGAEADAEEETAPEGAASRAGGPRGRSSGARLLDKARSASWRRTTRKKAQPAGELARRDADGGAAEGAAAEWAPHVLEQAEAVLRVTEGAIASHDAERTDVFKLLGVHRRSIADEEDTASVEDVDWSVPPSEGVSEHSVLQGDAAT